MYRMYTFGEASDLVRNRFDASKPSGIELEGLNATVQELFMYER